MKKSDKKNKLVVIILILAIVFSVAALLISMASENEIQTNVKSNPSNNGEISLFVEASGNEVIDNETE